MSISAAAALGISAGISALGSAGSGITSAKLNRKGRKFVREENEKSRQFNAEQAELAYKRQREFYDYIQQMYTSPSAQMRQLEAAGLNPDLVYSHGAFQGVTPASVQSATSSSGSSPQAFDVGTSIQRGASEIAEMNLSHAQREASIRNTNADTKEKEANTNESVSRTRNNGVLFDLYGEQVGLTASTRAFTDQELVNAKIEGENLVKTRDVMDAQINNFNKQAEFFEASTAEKNRIVEEMKSTYEKRFDMLDFSLKDLQNRCSIGESQAKYYYETLGDSIIKFAAETRSANYAAVMDYWDKTYKEKLMQGLDKDGRRNMQIMIDSTIGMLTSNAGMLQKQYQLLKDFGTTHEIINMVTQTLNSISQAFSAYKGAPGMPFNVTNIPGMPPQKNTSTGFEGR